MRKNIGILILTGLIVPNMIFAQGVKTRQEQVKETIKTVTNKQESEQINIVLLDDKVIFSNKEPMPFRASNGQVMVPVEKIFKELKMTNMQVYDHRVMGYYNGKMVEVYAPIEGKEGLQGGIRKGRYYVAEKKIMEDDSIVKVNNVIYAPIDTLMEGLGYSVNDENSEVVVTVMTEQEQKHKEFRYIGKVIDGKEFSKIDMSKVKELQNKNLEQIKDEISTIYDLLVFLREKSFQISSGGETGEQKIRTNSLVYYYNLNAEKVFSNNAGNCGGIANLAKYILGDDYEEIGYIHTSNEEGGHVINYFLKDGNYYLMDFTEFDEKSSGNIFKGKYAQIEDIVESYGNNMNAELIYVYSNYEHQIPTAIGHDRSVSYIPKGYNVKILKEGKVKVEYIDSFPKSILPKKFMRIFEEGTY